MYQLIFLQDGEEQTLSYPTADAANAAAAAIWKFDTVLSLTVLDCTDPNDPKVVVSWSRG